VASLPYFEQGDPPHSSHSRGNTYIQGFLGRTLHNSGATLWIGGTMP